MDTRVQAQLADVVGAAYVTWDETLGHRLGQVHPVLVARPADEAQVQEVLKIAHAAKAVVCPMGAGRNLGLGNLPQGVDLVISSERMSEISDYSPDDLVVSMQAGVTLGQLQATLAKRGQMLPIDPFCSDACTIGGLVACNLSGPRRTLYGTLRDMTIGLRVVYPNGDLIRTGGKVVKNVAGYDMTKLFIGSLGTLAFLTETVFKLRPLPLCRRTCVVSGTLGQVDRLRGQLVDSVLIPSRAEVIRGSSPFAGGAEWTFVIDCDENERASAYQADQIRRWAEEAGMTFEERIGQVADADWQAFRSMYAEAEVALRLSAPPNQVVKLCEALQDEWSGPAGGCVAAVHAAWSISALAGVARLFMEGADDDVYARITHICRARVEALGGSAVMERAPVNTLRQVDSFGMPPATFALFQGVKAAIDTDGRMSKGRFVGGM